MTTEGQLLQKNVALAQELKSLREENEILTDRAEDFLLLGIISEKIGLAKNKDEVIDVTLDSVASLKDIYYSAFLSCREDGVEIITDNAPYSATENEGKYFPLAAKICEAIANDEFIIICEEDDIVPAFIPEQVHGQRPKAFFVIPMDHQGENNSSDVFLFVSYIHDQDNLQIILPLFCRAVEIASTKIESISVSQNLERLNKVLDSKVQQRTAKLAIEIHERKATQLKLQHELAINQALAEVSKEVISSSNIAKVDDLVLSAAKRLTGSEHGFVGMIDPKTGDLVCYTLSNMMSDSSCLLEGADAKISFPVSPEGTYPNLWGHTLNTLEPFYVNDPGSHPTANGIPSGHIPLHRFLTAPAISNQELIGQIAVANAEQDYTADDIRSIERLADLYAMAINRRRAQEDREQLTDELRQAQKMEAIGTLAGGIAHDFNNILAAIMGYTELAKMNAESGQSINDDLDQVYIASTRASKLVKQILAFSRQSEHEFKPIQIHLLAKEVMKLLRSSLPTTIEIKQDIPSVGSFVKADPTQIHQVLMNLCTNAYHAMRETGGILAIKISEINIQAEDYIPDLPLLPGRYMKIEVGDTGCGIDEETKNKIFDPYFTTKKKGEGTGLGLAVVHGIIKSHHGHIAVYSEKGIGTTFHVYLPVMSVGVEEVRQGDQGKMVGGNERILFVDDEEAITKLGKILLERMGYTVTCFTDSLGALQAFKESPDNYDLIITDMTMPNMTGVELTIKVREVRSNIPVILCTGFSDLVNEEKTKAMGIDAYVNKPITLQDISETIRRVLASAR